MGGRREQESKRRDQPLDGPQGTPALASPQLRTCAGAESEAEAVRRNGLMQNIADGLPRCVRREHCDIYRIIRTMQPSARFTVNHNGAFLSLQELRTDVLEVCHQLVQHGLAQERKERKRAETEHRLHSQLSQHT